MRNQSNYTSSISTHTPTKGATLMDSPIWTHLKNFNPHSHEGSDVVCDTFCLFLQDFNPHSHEGSDKSKRCKMHKNRISTHTPTKGATQYPQVSVQPLIYFNPHSHEGSDTDSIFRKARQKNFNPHSHEGSDFTVRSDASRDYNFNPHSHEGSDDIAKLKGGIPGISTHTPTKGATFSLRLYLQFQRFQPTLPRRERLWQVMAVTYTIQDFNPHSHEGST